MNKKILTIAGVVAVLVVAGAASQWLGKSATERAIEAATGGNADVDVSDNNVTVKTDQGTWSTSDKLPADFPTDVPVYPGAKVQGSVASAGQDNTGHYAGLETTDALDDVIAWYKKEVKSAGWTIVTDATVNGSLILSATKDSRGLSVTVTKEGDKVVVGLVVANQ